MLDAFIIEEVRRKKDKEDWKPDPLDLELPVKEDELVHDQPDPRTNKKKDEQIAFQF